MDKVVKNLLKKIESEGYEAYIVGGFVRDFLLGKESFDVDICTSAVPMEMSKIFKNINSINEYGGINIKLKKYNVDITTYRKESDYLDKRHPEKIEYISNLIEDINRRDFTINALCLDKNSNVLDLINAKDDLNKKIIRTIGNPIIRFKEDPLRILRAIRFATVLDFTIEKETMDAIKDTCELINFLSSEKIKEELSKILASSNYKKGLKLLYETKICDILGLSFDDVVYTSDILGMWAQVNILKVNFSNTENNSIKMIRQILNIGKIDRNILFNYGLYLSLVAGEILGVSKEKINKIYKNMPIKSMKDININGKDVMNILDIKPSKKINAIMLDIKHQILDGKLKNKKSDIKKYIEKK